MGAAKEHWLNQQERGYLNADGEICADCVSDPDLKRWIQDNAVSTTCSFCGREDQDAIAAEMDEFVGAVLDGIRVDWNHPDTEGIAYESAEGGYQADLVDTYEVLEDCGVSDEEDVIQAIVDSMETDAWVAREFYRGSDSDRLSWGWDSFKEAIKHRTRYFFLEGDLYDDMPPARMLEKIADTIRRRPGGMDLIQRLPSDTNILRIRVDARRHDTAAAIGTPPAAFAIKANRMSPAGIPMFYGALDVDTAIAETREPGDIGKIMSIGTFKPVREIAILNLARLPDIPGVFNEAGRELIQPLRFLHPFADDISRPIAHDGREHIEYVPTQVVTEYFRQAFRDADGQPLDGIAYASSRHPGGVAVVLFCENERCVDVAEASKPGAVVQLVSVDHRLCRTNDK
jgi:hypothetical protein